MSIGNQVTFWWTAFADAAPQQAPPRFLKLLWPTLQRDWLLEPRRDIFSSILEVAAVSLLRRSVFDSAALLPTNSVDALRHLPPFMQQHKDHGSTEVGSYYVGGVREGSVEMTTFPDFSSSCVSPRREVASSTGITEEAKALMSAWQQRMQILPTASTNISVRCLNHSDHPQIWVFSV